MLQHFTNFTAFCRYRNGQLLDLSDRDRYEGATLDQPSLVIKSVSRVDNGRYSCVLENQVGASESKNAAALTVYCKYYYVITVLHSVWKSQKVSLNIASEASSVYILSGQKFIKNAKIEKFKCDILSDFQTMCNRKLD